MSDINRDPIPAKVRPSLPRKEAECLMYAARIALELEDIVDELGTPERVELARRGVERLRRCLGHHEYREEPEEGR